MVKTTISRSAALARVQKFENLFVTTIRIMILGEYSCLFFQFGLHIILKSVENFIALASPTDPDLARMLGLRDKGSIVNTLKAETKRHAGIGLSKWDGFCHKILEAALSRWGFDTVIWDHCLSLAERRHEFVHLLRDDSKVFDRATLHHDLVGMLAGVDFSMDKVDAYVKTLNHQPVDDKAVESIQKIMVEYKRLLLAVPDLPRFKK